MILKAAEFVSRGRARCIRGRGRQTPHWKSTSAQHVLASCAGVDCVSGRTAADAWLSIFDSRPPRRLQICRSTILMGSIHSKIYLAMAAACAICGSNDSSRVVPTQEDVGPVFDHHAGCYLALAFRAAISLASARSKTVGLPSESKERLKLKRLVQDHWRVVAPAAPSIR